uniref:Tc1-like transposase DDE domain-containing protein n=1 Tax=Cyprinus carpio carpio TaxID=630221 RepID=A0A9J8DAX3_CYPCA
MLTFDGVWHWKGVLFTDESQFSLYRADGRQCVWSCVVLAWPAYSPDMSPIEHVWDALDWLIRQRVPVPANILALVEEWVTFSQKELVNLVQSMRIKCTVVHRAAKWTHGILTANFDIDPLLFRDSLFHLCS